MRRSAADTPLLRVSRPVSACSRCRAAKIKCDGKLPACSACEKAGRQNECSSANDQFAKGKERSYVASLEARIEKLQKRIAYARSRKASAAMHDVDEDDDESIPERKDSLATIRAAIHHKAARRRDASDVNELVSDFGILSVNATSRDFDASTTNMTFARLILSASINESFPKAKPFSLPPRAEVMNYVQYYLDNIFCLLPVFLETTLITAVDAVYSNIEDHVRDFDFWLVYMVLAIASSAQSRSAGDAFYKHGVTWVSRALVYAESALTPGYISQIQSVVLLVEYSMLDPAHFDSWQLIGFACRAVVDMGFHQDPPKETQPERTLLDLRRRVFYCVYALDRSISMVHARAFAFSDDSMSVAFPDIPSRNPSSPIGNAMTGPHSIETAEFLFELRRIQSKWYQELFQSGRDPLQHASTYTWQMCQEMREWFESIPEETPQSIRDLFELELLYSYIYCLAPSCRIPAVSELGKVSIFEHSISYMHKMTRIAHDPAHTGFYTYHDALRVYFIGSQFLAVLRDGKDFVLNPYPSYVGAIVGAPTMSSPSSQTGNTPSPAPQSSGADNVDRSIQCIRQIQSVLSSFGERWIESMALLGSFEMQADPILADLHHRRQHLDLQNRTTIGSEVPGTTVVSSSYQGSYGQRPIDDVLSDEYNAMGRVYAQGISQMPDTSYLPTQPAGGVHEGGV